jgi:hypothetical protein
MTNLEKIKYMPIEVLADFLVDYDGEYDIWFCSDREEFERKEDAIKHEVEWLKSECVE